MASVIERSWRTAKGDNRTAWLLSWHDADGQRHRRQFPTKADADSFRIRIESKIQDGTFRAAADRLTVAEALRAFLAYCEERHRADERMSAHNLEVYRGYVEKHMLHAEYGLGAVRLGRLTASRIKHWLCDLRDKGGVRVQTRRKVLSTLRVALQFCIGEDLIAANPARDVKIITPRGEEPKKVLPPTKAAIKTLLSVLEDDPNFFTDVMFSALTGARAGEKRAIRWRSIDFNQGFVSITESVDRHGNVTPPKTVAGIRKVPMSDVLALKLKEHRLRSPFAADDDLVFPNSAGTHEDHDNLVKRKFEPALKKAGLSNITWHALRHYAVSTWIDAGMSPKEVQTFAGHSNLATTMDRYGHLFPKSDHRLKFNAVATGLS